MMWRATTIPESYSSAKHRSPGSASPQKRFGPPLQAQSGPVQIESSKHCVHAEPCQSGQALLLYYTDQANPENTAEMGNMGQILDVRSWISDPDHLYSDGEPITRVSSSVSSQLAVINIFSCFAILSISDKD